MTGFICPVCKNPLSLHEHSLQCSKKHTYDLAVSGYVNLLLSGQMNSKLPGDNKMMINSRRNFLDKGYYGILAEAVSKTVSIYAKNGDVILDAGCGEGYYTASIKRFLIETNISVNVLGIDISKFAVNIAAKRCKDVFYAAASVFHIPAADNSCSIITSLFSPFCAEEFHRVLKKGGILIMVIPSERHLIQLKEAVYDKPYLNEVKDYKLDGFTLLNCEKLNGEITLASNEDIKNLFTMTPYYYKTSAEDQEKLTALESLKTEIGFEILIYNNKIH